MTLLERRDLMLGHFAAIERTAFDPREALHKLRTMTGWYTRGLPSGRSLRVQDLGARDPGGLSQRRGRVLRLDRIGGAGTGLRPLPDAGRDPASESLGG